MLDSLGFYVPLATKQGFNASVTHIQNALSLLDVCNVKKNIADEIGILLENKELTNEEIPAFLSVILLDMWGYKVASKNLREINGLSTDIIAEATKWKGVDIVVGYHHPDLGFLAINPKNPANASLLGTLKKNELLNIYVGKQDKGAIEAPIAEAVFKAFFNLLEGTRPSIPAKLLNGPFVFTAPKAKKPSTEGRKRKAAKAPATAKAKTSASAVQAKQAAAPAQMQVPTGKNRISQQISVIVTNELFHNGNVEAWKRIIRSYNARYPHNKVIVFYDGEQIVDINTLFKWGKVKHGSSIQFAVAGEEIKDLSKLSKYFAEGASPRFEAFLRGSPSTVLNLF
ncbi:hypothetical protein ABK01_05525 [Treponema sp. OMZ 305]|uniref:hypothetical protein n=1 Tax=Treponema TaxID=157 RepID=UPI001BAEE890|nr:MULTISPECIES: hypothetical protein [Treponema]QUY17892.1 hypothetical protein GWP40_05720 [Treponema vincentii]UTC57773.1 hypothetical protein ABK01_05525 [Treponema sp. OMZ 305]